MAGNIQNLNIAQLTEKYQEYNLKVKALCEDLKKVYDEVNNLRNAWTGKRMNDVIEKYNTMSKKILESVQFFNKIVDPVLLEIKTQYQDMEDQGIAHDVAGSYWNIIDGLETPIALTSTDNVKFEQEKVISTVSSINSSLENVQTTLSSLVNILDDLKTCSDSLNKLVTNYNAATDSIIGSVGQIKESLKTEIDNAVKVVQSTEGYNDADASRVQNSESAE